MKTDSQIQSDVLQALKWDPSVEHEHIGVAVSDGIVTLSGSVPSYMEKSAAERAAQRVSGVKAVVEKIEVKLLGLFKRDDQSIAKSVVAALSWNVQIPQNAVTASVENGWVDLSGEVEWEFQRAAAEKSVRSLTGVRGVMNNIKLKPKTVQPDVIKQKIVDALKREAEREARHISVEVSGSKVTLSGDVHSFAEMNSAKWAAWSAPGVTNIENNLHVTD